VQGPPGPRPPQRPGVGHRISGRRDSQNANRRARRRGAPKGWEFVHVCVDDATRLAYVEVLADEKATTAVTFLRRAIAFCKAERVIRTLSAGWAYGAIYGTSRERTAALDGWIWTYNHRRPHGSLRHKPPIARLNELNNLPGSYS
jgi:transposase InsO family protein